jgi:hypothetical protein
MTQDVNGQRAGGRISVRQVSDGGEPFLCRGGTFDIGERYDDSGSDSEGRIRNQQANLGGQLRSRACCKRLDRASPHAIDWILKKRQQAVSISCGREAAKGFGCGCTNAGIAERKEAGDGLRGFRRGKVFEKPDRPRCGLWSRRANCHGNGTNRGRLLDPAQAAGRGLPQREVGVLKILD